MTSHKGNRNAMLGLGLARANFSPMPEHNEAAAPGAERVMSGAVGAVSRSLDHFQNQMKAVQDLVASGSSVVELDADLIEDSILKDRLEIDEISQAGLIASIQLNGQQVPILVRQHPSLTGRYQIAFGHRRVAACRTLGRKVAAVVRMLNDKELLIAQGQENSARRDLSFIERASFALKLEQRGLDRDAIMAAMSTDKTELSKLLSVARAVPAEIISAIGPAAKAGRPRWLGMAEGLASQKTNKKLPAVLEQLEFRQLTSDERFNRVFDILHAKPKRGSSGDSWKAPDGREIARIIRSDRVWTLAIDQKQAPDFGQYVHDRLPGLYQAFAAEKAGK